MHFKRKIIFAAVIFCSHAMAQDHEELVRRATTNHNHEYLDEWAFRETRSVGDEIREASYNPARDTGEHWKLISMNGEPPGSEEITDFLEEKEARKAEREENSDENGLQEMITPGSLELIEETTESWRFSFQPRDEEDEAFMEHVDGELVVIKDGHYVGNMTLKSRGPFKPQTGIRIKEFQMVMQMGPAGGSGPIVPRSISSYVLGKAFLVATVEENVVIEFSEYKRVD
jgi:hypothetical protein